MDKFYIGDPFHFEDERLSYKEKLVYEALCMFRNTKTNDCFPSLLKLSKCTGISKPSVTIAINTLVQCGYLIKDNRKNEKGGHISNLYVLTRFNDTPSKSKDQGGVNLSTKGSKYEDQPLVKEKTSNNNYINNNYLTNNISPQNESDSPSSKIKNDYSDEFEQFWKLYLKKEGKKTAYKAFNKARKEYSLEIIVEGLESYNAQIKRNGTKKQFIKNGSTFLNGEHFNDEYEEVENNANQNLIASVNNTREAED